MESGIYEDVIRQLNDRTGELKKQAEQVINGFFMDLQKQNVEIDSFNLVPVVSDEGRGVPNIVWFDNSKKLSLPCNLTTNTYDFSSFQMMPLVKQIVVKTEDILMTIRNELELVMSIFKKLDYWNKMAER